MTRVVRQPILSDLAELPIGVEPCRSDRCPIVGLHAAHKIWGGGRPPKHCPNCGGVIDAPNTTTRVCRARCGWERVVRPKEKSKR